MDKAFGYHEDPTPTAGYEPTRGSRDGIVRQELAARVLQWKPKTKVEATSILSSLNGKTARSWRGSLAFTHLAREERMTVTIGRRELLIALGGTAAAWPLTAWAQQPVGRLPRIGILYFGWNENITAFLQGSRDSGYIDGQSAIIEAR